MELLRALATLTESPEHTSPQVIQALGFEGPPDPTEYTETFTLQLYPYASVYLGAEGMLGGDARDRIAGFWRALGETPPTEPDHLATLLALYATMVEHEVEAGEEERRARARQVRHAFLWEHLLSWLPPYLAKLAEIAPPVYRRWGEMLEKALLYEAREVGPPSALPSHLRDAPDLSFKRDDVEGLISGLLAPVRSGMIITRADLVRGARELGVASRMGERRFMLEAMLGQDSASVVEWLRGEAEGWVERHRARHEVLGCVSEFWTARVATCAERLGDL